MMQQQMEQMQQMAQIMPEQEAPQEEMEVTPDVQ